MISLVLAILATLLLVGPAWAVDPWAGCDFLTAGPGMTITCPNTTTGGATLTSSGSGNVTGTFLVSGGGVAWVSGYTFTVSAATYFIDGVLTTSTQQNVTLDAADPANDRIDAIILDSTGTASALTGTPGSPPFNPTVDPTTQLSLTFVLVQASSTEPGVVKTLIYDENTGGPGEWAATSNTARIVTNSTNFPNTGTIDIEGTSAVLNDQVTFVKPSGSVDLSTQDILVFNIRVKAAWPANKRIRLLWQSGSQQLGVLVDVRDGLFGFNSSLTGQYQQIVVPVAQFGIEAGSTVDTLIMRIIGGGAAVGFYWDTIFPESGLPQPPPAQIIPAPPVSSIQINADGAHLGAYAGAACSAGEFVSAVDTFGALTCAVPGGTGAPTTASYVTQTAEAGLSAEFSLGSLTTGLLLNTVAAGTGTPSAYAGTSCTNQFVRSLNASGAATCATVATTDVSTVLKTRTCTVIIGDPGAASPVLANDNDSPVACSNDFGADWTITMVAGWADAGSPTVTPILTGGASTSILTGALTCGTAAWAAGTLNGSPVVKTFSGGGATCSSTPCSADVNITTAGGVAKYVVVKITGTLP